MERCPSIAFDGVHLKTGRLPWGIRRISWDFDGLMGFQWDFMGFVRDLYEILAVKIEIHYEI